MAKGGASKMLYFVLYVVLITELMIVITERDELEEKEHEVRNKMLGSIAQAYKNPIIISPSEKLKDFNLGSPENKSATEVLNVLGLVSDEEKEATVFYVDVAPGSKNRPAGWPAGGINSKDDKTGTFRIMNNNGTGEFAADISSEGDYKFVTYCKVTRAFPGYLPSYLLEDLKAMVSSAGDAQSNKAEFTISAKRQGGVVRKGVEF